MTNFGHRVKSKMAAALMAEITENYFSFITHIFRQFLKK